MLIHTVQPGETIYSIAELYGVSAERLLLDNLTPDPNRLVAGQSLLVLFPRETHIVREGDSLEGIAASYGVTATDLLRNNPQLSGRIYIYPGEELIISYTDEKTMPLSVNGYALPFIDPAVLQSSLPYLTYLSIFYYRITSEGTIINIDDQEAIDTAKAYGVAPIMLISTFADSSGSDAGVGHSVFISTAKQELLIDNVLTIMRAKGYYGVNIDIQNVLLEDRQLYVDFVANLSSRVKEEGYYVMITLTPNTFLTAPNTLYQGPEYAILGQLTDSTMLLSYEWGNAQTPQPALPLAQVRAFLDYSITQIPAEKTNIGVITIGYIWELPFVPSRTVANVITHNSALGLAEELGRVVLRDAASEAPYFTFFNDTEFIIWFRDTRSVSALLDIVAEYNLEGIGIWNIMQSPTELLLMVNARFEIRKVDLN